MAKIRDVLIHVDVEVGRKKRKCHRSRGKHDIPKGKAHLIVKGGSFGARKNYCADCARPILEGARAKLDRIAQELGCQS